MTKTIDVFPQSDTYRKIFRSAFSFNNKVFLNRASLWQLNLDHLDSEAEAFQDLKLMQQCDNSFSGRIGLGAVSNGKIFIGCEKRIKMFDAENMSLLDELSNGYSDISSTAVDPTSGVVYLVDQRKSDTAILGVDGNSNKILEVFRLDGNYGINRVAANENYDFFAFARQQLGGESRYVAVATINENLEVQELSRIDLANVHGMHLDDTRHLYVAHDNFISVINVMDPAVPVLEKTVLYSERTDEFAVFLKTHLGKLYAMHGIFANYVKIYDANLEPVGKFRTKGFQVYGCCYSLAMKANFLYFTGRSEALEVYDISRSDNVQLISESRENVDFSKGVSAYGENLFILDANRGLDVFNVADPSKPIFDKNIEGFGTDHLAFNSGWGVMSGRHANGDHVVILEASNKNDIHLREEMNFGYVSIDGVAALRDRLVVVDDKNGVTVINPEHGD